MLRFRRYRSADREAVLRVFRSNVPDYFAAAEEPWLKQVLREAACPLFVLTEDRDLIGFGGFEVAEFANVAYLVFGMVDRRHHGRGLGRRLLEFRLARIAVARRAPRYVAVDTTPAIAPFFEHCGFDRIAEWPEGYRPGFDRIDLRYDFAKRGVSPPAARSRRPGAD
jgi:GNAT superfamily N-acetyltransferase